MPITTGYPPAGDARLRRFAWFAGALLAACGGSDGDRSLEPLPFDGGELQVEWQPSETGDSTVSFRLIADIDGETMVLYRGTVDTGGAEFSWDNLRPATESAPDLRLCLNGGGKPTRSLRLNVRTRTVVEIERPCLP